jgi:hypothetical protein
MTRIFLRFTYFVAAVAVAASSGTAGGAEVHTTPLAFWTPRQPPRADYKIDCTLTMADEIALQGRETIHFVNTTSRPMQTLALTWFEGGRQTLTVVANGEPVALPRGPGSYPQDFALNKPIQPGQAVTLEIEFSASATTPPEKPEKPPLPGLHPELWWGCDSHNNYEVKLSTPEEYAVATSGRLDPKSGTYRVEKAPSFGVWLARGYGVLESHAGDVSVRCLYKPADKKCAQLLVDTAVDVIDFYRERFGFYPYPALAIVPGDLSVGGCPLATSIIAIHGMSRQEEQPESHWRWITAHEIAHQYWGEYVTDKDDPAWLWIGLGIYADREYSRARGLGDQRHRACLECYTSGVREGLDTTVSRSQEEKSQIKFDFNNVVIHGKGFAIISALACTLGAPTFDRIYRRCLDEFGGRWMGLSEFRSVCEQERGEDLGWFFDPWVNSNKYLAYGIAAQDGRRDGDMYTTDVRVRCLGTLTLPVPVLACFEDGTSQRVFTNRLHDVDTLRFQSRAPLKEVRLDPEGVLPMVVPPPALRAQDLSRIIDELPYVGAGEKARDLFQQAKQSDYRDADNWCRLGIRLYDGKYYAEAMEAFEQVQIHGKNDRSGIAIALVWQGHLFDLHGQRDQAITYYQKALEKLPESGSLVQYDQYGIVFDRTWVQKRLEEPFRRQ